MSQTFPEYVQAQVGAALGIPTNQFAAKPALTPEQLLDEQVVANAAYVVTSYQGATPRDNYENGGYVGRRSLAYSVYLVFPLEVGGEAKDTEIQLTQAVASINNGGQVLRLTDPTAALGWTERQIIYGGDQALSSTNNFVYYRADFLLTGDG